VLPAVTSRPNRTEEVRAGLLEELLGGRSPVGTKLPNEQELAKRFQVSRATVREAVRGLVDGGYLVRRHGSGTYVTSLPRRQHSLDLTLSYTHMIRDAGMVPGLKVLSLQSRPADDEEAEALGIEPGAPIRVLERLRTADEQPIIYSVDRIPAWCLGDLPDSAFEVSLFDLLAEAGLRVRTASAVLLPVNADATMARTLNVQCGAALQHITEVDFTGDGTAVAMSSEWHVPGVFELRVNRRS
jgi:GntR family transcriptional regulator